LHARKNSHPSGAITQHRRHFAGKTACAGPAWGQNSFTYKELIISIRKLYVNRHLPVSVVFFKGPPPQNQPVPGPGFANLFQCPIRAPQ
jgi:hypothetical protein